MATLCRMSADSIFGSIGYLVGVAATAEAWDSDSSCIPGAIESTQPTIHLLRSRC